MASDIMQRETNRARNACEGALKVKFRVAE